MIEPCDLSATAARRAIEAGELSAEALTRSCLDRIAARDGEIVAWAALDADGAIARARSLDRGPKTGPLHGLPIGIKDLVATRDLPTTYGSAIYAGARSPFDAALVSLARGAGAVILGKTVTTEFAHFSPSATRNPRDPSRSPGGSSSGSAAAVAAGMTPLCLGTQTAASIVRPAAFCGIVGYKPSFGLVEFAGIKPLARSLDTAGILAREVADAALAVEALTGLPLVEAALAGAAPLRIGLCRSPAWRFADDEMKAAFEEFGAWLAGQGAACAEVELPPNCETAYEAQIRIMAFELSRALAFEAEAHWDALSPHLRKAIDDGRAIPRATYEADVALAGDATAAFADACSGFDALVTPAACGVAPLKDSGTGDPAFGRLWTLFGAPSVSVPGLTSREGLPLGVQIVAPRGRDAAAISCAAWLEGRFAARA